MPVYIKALRGVRKLKRQREDSENELLHRNLFEYSEDGFILLEPVFDENGGFDDYRILWVNAALERQTGKNASDLIGKRITEALLDTGFIELAILDEVAGTGNARHVESHRADTDRWYDLHVFPYRAGRVGVLFCDITERKKREKELAFTAHVLENVHDAIFVIDSDSIITYWSPEAERIMGWTSEQAVGQSSKDIFKVRYDQLGSTRQEEFDKLFANDRYSRELVYRTKNGEEINVSTHASVVRNADGSVKEIVTSFMDITEHKRAEMALRESEARFRLMAETINSAFWISEFSSSGDLRYIYMSPAFEGIFGIPVERIYNDPHTWMSLIHKEDRERFFSAMRSRAAGEYADAPNIRIVKPDGTIVWINTKLFPIKDGDGRILHYVGIADDITLRKQAEYKIFEQAKLLDQVEDAIISTDMEFIITSWNRAAEDIYGYLAEEALEKNVDILLQTEFAKANRDEMAQRLFAEGKATVEVIHIRKDGSKLNVMSKVSLVYQSDGTPIGTVGVLRDITEHKKAEQALLVSEKRQAFLMRLNDAIKPLLDAKEIQRAAMRTVAEYLAVDRALYNEITDDGKTIHIEDNYVIGEFPKVTGDFPIESFGAAMDVLRGGEVLVIEDQRTTSLKKPLEREASISFQILASATVPLIKQGRWVANFGVLHGSPRKWSEDEITILKETAERTWVAVERAKAEQKLRESEELFRAVSDNSLDNLAILKPFYDDSGEIVDFICVYQNAQAEIAGKSLREVIGRRASEYFPSFPQSNAFAKYKKVVETGLPLEFEEHYHTDGIALWYRIVASPVPHGVAVASQVINERKEAEDALKLLSEDLAAEVESLETLHRINTRFIKYADANTIYQEILEESIALTGADCGNMQMVADDLCSLEMIAHKGYSEAFAKRYRRIPGDQTVCLKTMEDMARTIEEDMPHSTIFDEDDRRFLQEEGLICVQSTPMLSAAGNLLGILSTHYKSPHKFSERELRNLDLLSRQAADVMERINIEQALKRSEEKALALVEELQAADSNKNLFINTLSHELRNPLAAIDAWLQMVESSKVTIDILNVQGILRRQVDQLISLVEDLLEISRIMNNKIVLYKEIIELNDLVQQEVKAQRVKYESKGIGLDLILFTEPININADPARITQIVGNLLDNAYKFTDTAGTVRVEIEAESDLAKITVTDNGVGLDSELLPVIFKPFMQAEQPLDRANGGMGIGLSIVKGITELHGGTVFAKSDGIGKGAAFTICLPLERGMEIQQRETESKESASAFHVLVIEDNRDLANAIGTVFCINGHTVVLAHNGLQAIEMFKAENPDIVVCDIGLPGIDGYEVAKRIRQIKTNKCVTLIALSGYGGEHDIERGIKSGFDEYLVKPVSVATIQDAIRKLTYRKAGHPPDLKTP